MTADGPRRVRAFVALELDAAARAGIDAIVDALRPRIPDVRWTASEARHVTMRFFGASAPETLARLLPALGAAAAACPAFDAPLGPLGTFPGRGSPRVLWLAVALPPRALALQAACESAAADAGFAPEARELRPHLTLGRFRDGARRPSLPSPSLEPARVSRLVLFRSDLRPGGAAYTPLAVFPLG